MVKRKILLIGRHGEAPQKPEGGSKDELLPEAFSKIYLGTGMHLRKLVEDYGLLPEMAFLRHTPKVRTRYTGQTILISGFNMQPSEGKTPPKSAEDLAKYDLSMIESIEDKRLLYSHPCNLSGDNRDDFNLALFRQGKPGQEKNINYWLNTPDTDIYEGELTVPGRAIIKDCREVTQDNLRKLVSRKNNKDLGVSVAHAGRVDICLIHLINSGRSGSRQIRDIMDIGGICNMGEFATLSLEDMGLDYKANLEYRGSKFNVMLDRILDKKR
ncbi:MAG: hypothetical protein NT001_07375 [Candidatus Woesearchaeota archaeon]|nr:hypothetical protein [Candidatus Woesearchaeota archaeon]